MIRDLYEQACVTPSDINEHLPTLYELALDLDAQVVIELGVRTGNSTIAWLAAMEKTGGWVCSVDIDPPPPGLVGCPSWRFIRGDDLDGAVISEIAAVAACAIGADVLFVDTIHTYGHTAAELDAYVPLVKPDGAVVLHDTAVESFPHHVGVLSGQPPFPVRRAVTELLDDTGWSAEWRENNNGLVVIHRGEL